MWVDRKDCKAFVDNIMTAFHTKVPRASLLAKDFPRYGATDSPTAGTHSLSLGQLSKTIGLFFFFFQDDNIWEL